MEYGEKTEIKDFKMVSHMSGSKQHIHNSLGVLHCSKHICHKKNIIRVIETPVLSDWGGLKEFGDEKHYWFLEETPKTEFNSLEDLAKHYKLP